MLEKLNLKELKNGLWVFCWASFSLRIYFCLAEVSISKLFNLPNL